MDVTMAEPGEILPERNVDMEGLYDILRLSKASAEEIVSKMLSLKKQNQPTPKSQLSELVNQLLLAFITLRQANRSILLEEDLVKTETERAKAPVDFTTLQLHNLMYEKNHYVKAIKACNDFKTRYPHIQLIPEEQFLTDAPQEIKTPVLSHDTCHDIMLKRLNYELLQRKELCKLRDKLDLQKKSLQETIANRKKFLSSLPMHLKALKKASLPVQNHLGVLHTKKLKQQQLAELLPPPLYLIYSQLLAQKEAFGEKIDMEIMGSVKEAQAFARQLSTMDPVISTTSESYKLDDEMPDEDDDGQRRRKRPKKIQTKDSLDQSGIYQSHPLKVMLLIYEENASQLDTAILITLKFEFLIKLNVVSVGLEGSTEVSENDILCNLFPDDNGLELPQQSAKLRVGNSISFDGWRKSRPYKWAQHLAGIDFLPEFSPLVSVLESSNGETTNHASGSSGLSAYRQQNRVQTFVERIRSRKKAQMVLLELLDALTKHKWPTLTGINVPWVSDTPRCNLHGWFADAGQLSKHLPITEAEHAKSFAVTGADSKTDMSKRQLESTTEDGELLLLVPSGVSDDKLTMPSRITDLQHSRRLSLMSKSIKSHLSKRKSQTFISREEDIDLILESDDEFDEAEYAEKISVNTSMMGGPKVDDSWSDCGAQEYNLVLTRKCDDGVRYMKLDAKVKVSIEYPIRPPHFTLGLYSSEQENHFEANCAELFNELRAMEAEVNIHILRNIPFSEENFVLGHQVLCIAMLFDILFDKSGLLLSEKNQTSVIDIGLSRPVTGGVVNRSFRGRDHRKLVSWKDNICTSGYPR